MKDFRYRIEYGLILLLDFMFWLIPIPIGVKVGEYLGLLLSHIIPKRQRLIIENLTKAFPGKSAEEIKKIARGTWRNLGRIAVEFVYLPRLVRNETLTMQYEGEGLAYLKTAEEKGAILLTAHFTNWEILGAFMSQHIRKLTAIARPMHNPYVDKWVASKRTAAGVSVILHRDAVRASLKVLRKKGAMGILIDQNLYTGGVFVNFFNRPASSTTLPALLHARTGFPVHFVYILREGMSFRVVVGPPIDPPEGNSDPQAHMQKITDELESVIRRYPENWFWIHNRWKRKN